MFSNGSLIVVGVVLLGLLGVGLKIRAGSEIDKHPSDGLSHTGGAGAPQASGSSELTARDEGGPDPLIRTAPHRRSADPQSAAFFERNTYVAERPRRTVTTPIR
jgi:hypothetical protein